MGGGLAYIASLRGTNPPCIRLPASVRSNTALAIRGNTHFALRPSHFALRTSHFAVRRWALAVQPGERERGRTGCRSVFQNPNEVRRPAPGPESGRLGTAEPGTGAVKPEGVLPSWSWFLFGRALPPLEVRSRQPVLTRSRQVRHAAKEFFVGGGLASFFAPLRGTNPPCIRLPASVRSNTALTIRATRLRTSHFALRRLGLRRSTRRTGAREDGMPLRISEPERSEAPRAGPGGAGGSEPQNLEREP